VSENNRNYYAKRLRQENDLAARAADQTVRRIHSEFAAAYERKLAGETGGGTSSGRPTSS